jgi:hypothetical protein
MRRCASGDAGWLVWKHEYTCHRAESRYVDAVSTDACATPTTPSHTVTAESAGSAPTKTRKSNSVHCLAKMSLSCWLLPASDDAPGNHQLHFELSLPLASKHDHSLAELAKRPFGDDHDKQCCAARVVLPHAADAYVDAVS